MKIILISVLLTLGISHGFSVHKIQKHLPKPANQNDTDLYEVQENGQNVIRLLSPKGEKPTLREIVYYHVVEWPYGEQKDIPVQGINGPDVGTTRRPFTNGHGYQFLNKDPEFETSEEETIEIIEVDEQEETEEEAIDGEEILEEEEGDNPEETDKEAIDEEEDNQDEIVEEDIKKSEEIDTNEIKHDEVKKEHKDIESLKKVEDVSKHFYEETTIKPDQTKNARNRLFDQARSKYQDRRPGKLQHRNRRSIIKSLPPAPTLSPLDTEMLPEYERKLLAKPEKAPSFPAKEKPSHLNEIKDIEKRIDDMLSSLKPQHDEEGYDGEDGDDGDDGDDVNDGDDDDDVNDGDDGDDVNGGDDVNYDEDDDDYEYEDNDLDEEGMDHQRTYGFKLANGRGYVWNDLVSEPGTPGILFDVGEPENIDEVTQQTENIDKPSEITDFAEPDNTVSHPTESKPIHVNPIDNPAEIGDFENPANSDNAVSNPTDIEAVDGDDEPNVILLEPEQDKEMNHKEDIHNKDEQPSDHKDLEDIQVKPLKPDPTFSSEDNKVNDESEGDKVTKDDEKKPLDDVDSTSSLLKSRRKGDKPKKIDLPDAIKELMNNEEFWKWLGDWTATYMELAVKHIKRLVHDEVHRQIKKTVKSFTQSEKKKDDNNERDKEQNTTPLKDAESTTPMNDGKESEKKTEDNSNEPDEEKNITGSKDAEPTDLKNDTLVIDGKEIPVAHTTNFDEAEHKLEEKLDGIDNNGLKREKDSNKKHNSHKKSNTVSVHAKNIFGNAPNSDKVTNVFMFYSDGPKMGELINEIKPLLNSSDNLFAFSNTMPSTEMRHPNYTEQSDASTNTEDSNLDITKPVTDSSQPSIDIKHPDFTEQTDTSSNTQDSDKDINKPVTDSPLPSTDIKHPAFTEQTDAITNTEDSNLDITKPVTESSLPSTDIKQPDYTEQSNSSTNIVDSELDITKPVTESSLPSLDVRHPDFTEQNDASNHAEDSKKDITQPSTDIPQPLEVEQAREEKTETENNQNDKIESTTPKMNDVETTKATEIEEATTVVEEKKDFTESLDITEALTTVKPNTDETTVA